MNFDFSKDQNLIKRSIREYFKREWPMDRTREVMADEKGYDPNTWKKMAELGFTGLAIPDQYGGSEGEFLELAILMEEIGNKVVPCPAFTAVGQCVPAIVAYGSEAQKERFLPDVIEKGDIWSLGLTEARAGFEATGIQLAAEAKNEGFVLNGHKTFLSYANSAKYLLVAARTANTERPEDGITVFAIRAASPGIGIEVAPTPAPGVRCNVRFDKVSVSREDVLGEVNGGWQVVDHILQCGSVLKAAEMLGGIQGALELATKYARDRIQFDRPIASFQVIQHKLVEMMTETELLRNQVYEAAWKMSVGHPSRLLNSMAKLKANGVYHRVCFDAIGIHGAIGWTAEMNVSLYLLRSKDLENDCGGSDFHRNCVARELDTIEPDFMRIEGLA